MRYNEFNISDPIDDLADRLVKIGRGPTDFNVIKKLIDRVSVDHQLPSRKLHNMFVTKYGHSPDTWVRKIKQRNENVNEADTDDQNLEQIEKFIAWTKEVLHVKGNPQFTFSKDTEEAQQGHHTGRHSGNEIWVYIGNRNLVDIFRTIFHELVHQRQDELGMIKNGDSYPGSPIEAMADMLAGKYIKIYGKEHPEIFQ
jgi:putative heme degradation protein